MLLANRIHKNQCKGKQNLRYRIQGFALILLFFF